MLNGYKQKMLTIWFYKLSLNNVISLKDLGLLPISFHCIILEAFRLSDLSSITTVTISLATHSYTVTISLATHSYTVSLWFTIFSVYFYVTTPRKISS